MLTENEIIKLLKKSKYFKYVSDKEGHFYSTEYFDVTPAGTVFIKGDDIRIGSIMPDALEVAIDLRTNEKRNKEIKKLKSILKGK